MLKNFVNKIAKVCVPRWRLFNVVKTRQFELLWTILKQTNSRWRQILRWGEHLVSLPRNECYRVIWFSAPRV